MYVLDTSCLIQAYRNDFPPNAGHADFWEWLNTTSASEDIIIPEKVAEELEKKTDGLSILLSNYPNLKQEPTSSCLVDLPTVMNKYGHLSDVDLERLEKKADAYVLAHGLVLSATVVSCEISEPNRIGINKKIPDIATALNVQFESYTGFLWRMRGLYP